MTTELLQEQERQRQAQQQQQAQVPTVPDKPGGQVATVDGKEVYIAGSTMREVYGFETSEQYIKAQKEGLGKPEGKEVWYGPAVGGEQAIKDFAEEHGLSEKAAKETMTRYWQDPKSSEFVSLTEAERRSLEAAVTKGASPYDIAPKTTVAKYGEPAEAIRKYESYEVAEQTLSRAGLIDSEGYIKARAFELAQRDAQIKQALYSVGLSGRIVSEGMKEAQEIKVFESQHQRLPDGSYVPRDQWAKVALKYKRIGMEKGYDAMIEAIDADIAEYENQEKDLRENYYRLPDGSYVKKDEFKRLDETYRVIGKTKGYDAMVEAIDRDIAKANVAEKKIAEYKDEEGNYSIVKYLKDNKNDEAALDTLRDAGFSEASIKEASEAAGRGWHQEAWRQITPWDESKGEKATPKGAAVMGAEMIVPGVYTARRWNELDATGRAIAIAVDVLFLLPFVGAAARGARIGATFGRAAMAKGAVATIGREAVAQTIAPVNMIIHPIGTVKATVKQVANLAENIAHPKKISYAVLTTTEGTVRIPVTKNMTKAQAMAARDALLAQARAGERLVVQVGDTVIQPTISPFMREVKKAGGAVTHATPAGESFERALTVAAKQGKPLSEQGIFFAHEPLPRFAEQAAFGGVERTRPTIYITSKETAAQMRPSDKIYRSAAELETVLPPGAKTAGPQQRLFTRIGPNADRIQILLEKPLTARQLARLKAETLLEAVKAPFKPAIRYSAKPSIVGLRQAEVQKLAKALRAAGNTGQTRALLRADRIARAARVAPRSLSALTGRVAPGAVRAAREDMLRNVAVAGRARPERVTRAERIVRIARAERPERIARAERVERIARAERPERLTRAERVERIARAERAERISRADRVDRVTRADRVDRAERVERVERVDRVGRVDRVDRISRPIRPDRPERPERPERPDRPDRPDRPRLPDTDADAQKRALIRQSRGAVAWNMGKLGRKNPQDIWHVRLPDGKHLVLRGAPPKGARILADGPGSAYKTTQAIGEPLRRAITQQHGAVRATITSARTAKGAEARFSPTGIRSIKRGKQYFTPMRGGMAVSRRPLRSGRRRR